VCPIALVDDRPRLRWDDDDDSLALKLLLLKLDFDDDEDVATGPAAARGTDVRWARPAGARTRRDNVSVAMMIVLLLVGEVMR
jgi:hypothetical protein